MKLMVRAATLLLAGVPLMAATSKQVIDPSGTDTVHGII